MKVLELKTREVIKVNDSYGARLIEQGRAVLVPKVEKAESADMHAEAENAHEPAKLTKKR